MSETAAIHTIIPQIKRDVGAVGKSSRNQAQGFDFRGVDDVVNACARALIEHGVTVYPVAAQAHHRDVETSSGKASRECVVTVTYRWLGPAGDHLDAVVVGEAMDTGDKAAAKAMSVAYRIALLQTLSLPTGDRDPDAETFERQKATPQQQKATPTANDVRNEIARIAADKNMSLDVVADDFAQTMNLDIVAASVATLAEYRDRLAEYPDAS